MKVNTLHLEVEFLNQKLQTQPDSTNMPTQNFPYGIKKTCEISKISQSEFGRNMRFYLLDWSNLNLEVFRDVYH